MKKPINNSILDIIPIRYYLQEENCFQLDDDTYMDVIKIQTKDLVNSSPDEVEYDCLKMAKLYRLYSDDIKLICLNFPCDYSAQKRYLEYKINKTANQIFKKELDTKRNELIWLEKNNTIREYYFGIFADSIEELKNNRSTLTANLGTGRNGLLERISIEKKLQIFYRMTNKCASSHC